MCNSTALERVFKLQKLAARTFLDVRNPSSIRSCELFKTLNWLPLPMLANYNKCVMVFKAFNNLSPPYITDMFSTTTVCRTRGQSSNLLRLPRAKTEQYKRSFRFSASVTWNNLPPHLRTITSLYSFKSELSKYFMSEKL